MQLRHTVDLAATDDGEVSHADLPGVALLDERHPGEPLAVAGELLLDCLQEDAVDYERSASVQGRWRYAHRFCE